MLKKVYCILFLCVASAQYDYILEDVNSSSSTYGQQIGTSYFEDFVTLHYFGYFT